MGTDAAEPRAEVWLFDVDGCLVDSLTGTSLRPGASDLLTQLRSSGRTALLWSAGGAEYAERRAAQTGVVSLFAGFFAKDHRSDDGRYTADHVVDDVTRVVFVDDRPDDMPAGAQVIAVAPYISHNPHDRSLVGLAERLDAPSASA